MYVKNTAQTGSRGQYTSNGAGMVLRFFFSLAWKFNHVTHRVGAVSKDKSHISSMKGWEEVDITHVTFSPTAGIFIANFSHKIIVWNLNLSIDLASPDKTSSSAQSSLSLQWSSGLLDHLFLWRRGQSIGTSSEVCRWERQQMYIFSIRQRLTHCDISFLFFFFTNARQRQMTCSCAHTKTFPSKWPGFLVLQV